MTEREDDLHRRAVQQSQTGNYWAGKCVGLLDKLARIRAAWETEVELQQRRHEAMVGRFVRGWEMAQIDTCRPHWQKKSRDGSTIEISQMTDYEAQVAARFLREEP